MLDPMTKKLLDREPTPQMIAAAHDLRLPPMSDDLIATIWRAMHDAGGMEVMPLYRIKPGHDE